MVFGGATRRNRGRTGKFGKTVDTALQEQLARSEASASVLTQKLEVAQLLADSATDLTQKLARCVRSVAESASLILSTWYLTTMIQQTRPLRRSDRLFIY